MARQARIIVLGDKTPASDRLVSGLRQEAFDVRPLRTLQELQNVEGPPDLLIVDATGRAGALAEVLADVRACRQAFPPQSTPLLVVGDLDPEHSAAAIEAGATDVVGQAPSGPLLNAHVRRLIRGAESLRTMLDDERQKAKRESLALAAADVAVPLGKMIDELEAVMGRSSIGGRLDELLELTGRAVDAVDRLRQMATEAERSGNSESRPPERLTR